MHITRKSWKLIKNCMQRETNWKFLSKKRITYSPNWKKFTIGFRWQWPSPRKNNKNTQINLKLNRRNIKYKIWNKIWLTLKNITMATENKKLDAKQTKYTILENMGFHNFRLNTLPNIRNVIHVDKLRAISTNFLFSKISNNNQPGPTIIGNENGTHEYDVETILNKKKGGRSYQYLVKWKNYARFTWEPTLIIKKYRCFGWVQNQFELKKG